MTPRMRKSKPAPPPPPILTSTPQNESLLSHINCNESPIQELISDDDLCKLNMWEDQKSNKDEVNRTRQSLTCHDSQSYASYADKSVQGKWKRKKGPAPPRPVPLRRKVEINLLNLLKSLYFPFSFCFLIFQNIFFPLICCLKIILAFFYLKKGEIFSKLYSEVNKIF